MDDIEKRRRQRLLKRLEALGTNEPRCGGCGEADPFALERHHTAGRRYDGATVILCANCHRKLSNAQRDHASMIGQEPTLQEVLTRFLQGLADMLELVVISCREFAERLKADSASGVSP